jgi:hypothetical protein
MPYYGGGGGGGTPPAGVDGSVQRKLGTVLAGDEHFHYDPATKTLKVGEVLLRALVTGNESILVGQNLACSQGNTVLVGRGMTANVANAVILTNGGTPPAQQDCIVIGRPSLAGQQKSIHIGRVGGANAFGAISVGADAQATHSRAVAIGEGARSRAVNRATFGSDTKPLELEATSHVRARGGLMAIGAEPADADLQEGEVALFADPITDRLRIKLKRVGGAIRTGEVVLA